MTPETRAEEVQEEMDCVLVELGVETGMPAILHLVGLRGKQSAPASLRWHETLSKVRAVVTWEGGEQKATHSYSLPDLRNSSFLPNVQPPQGRALQKWRESHPQAENIDISCTTDLVKGRQVQRVRQKLGQSVRGVGSKIQVGQKIQSVRRILSNRNMNVE